jgi:hypothetical protein
MLQLALGEGDIAKGVRGNVKDANVLTKFTEYGPAYLR